MSDTLDFYQAQAEICRAEAASTDLEQVRNRSLRSAAVFEAMANQILRSRTRRAGVKVQEPASG
ncbi:hypothetical protein GGC65_003953 [Sphingopyxis sp. OAS728]|uniref:hypothetical protein n=1 Tax=Sphingopyxis sp. OAS728 TaxID=2663823 RepID=UPI001789952B|nr:hypothetical protein [Sphingopyxis sp. OAS728]MBE1529497.1 hypothetical protein [Sphingopyxis sp. OAS728]